MALPNLGVFHRVMAEVHMRTDRFRAPWRERALDQEALLESTDADSLGQLWDRSADRLHAVVVRPVPALTYDRLCPGDRARILEAAGAALERRVDLTGSGTVGIGSPVEWHTDFQSGSSWPVSFMGDINYVNLGDESNVTVPWTLSRVQWLIPAGQAFLLTGDERYADAVRNVLDEWIAANPYARGVNWICTAEVAMRIVTWTWLFHVFSRSRAWADESFRLRFLRTLYLQAEFTDRYLHRSQLEGRHLTVDAVGLVFAGLFFGRGAAPARWGNEGWRLLGQELAGQVLAEGVTAGGSGAHHRFVLELLFLAARYREACGLPVPDDYRDKVVAMARFTMAYSRHDGSSPQLGRPDEARTLPFGGQPAGDHRYLMGLIGSHWNAADLVDASGGSTAEILWTLGPRAAASLRTAAMRNSRKELVRSAAFVQAGMFVMRNPRDHVFISYGPAGMSGRGTNARHHWLSFEAVLDGVHLTLPQADDQERNPFGPPDSAPTDEDATPHVRRWEAGHDRDVFVGAHGSHQHPEHSIQPVRTILLEHDWHALTVTDEFGGGGQRHLDVPLYLAPGVHADLVGNRRIVLTAGSRMFLLGWSSGEVWSVAVEPSQTSPSHGLVVPIERIVWRRTGQLPTRLTMRIEPQA